MKTCKTNNLCGVRKGGGVREKNQNHIRLCQMCVYNNNECMKQAKKYLPRSVAECATKKIMCRRICKVGIMKCREHCKNLNDRCLSIVHSPDARFHAFVNKL